MAGKSPTEQSLAVLRALGYTCWITEKWQPFPPPGHRVDMFNFVDIIALGNNEVLFVQTTSASNVSARVKKIMENEYLDAVRKAGVRIEVHGWLKKKVGRRYDYKQKVVDLS